MTEPRLSVSVASEPPTKPLLQALAGRASPQIPIWLMRQAGRYLPEYRELRARAETFLDLCLTPDLAVEITLQPIRRYGFDAAILFSDILVIPHALGQRVWFEEGAGPKLEAITDRRGLGTLRVEDVVPTLGPVLETVSRLSAELDRDTTLIGFAGAPWTVASYMIEGGSSKDFLKTKTWAYGDPVGFQALIDLLVEATVNYLSAQVEAGAEALQLFDSWAGALPPQEQRRWCLEPAQAIVRRIKAAHPTVPVILFPRGAGGLYRDYAESAGAAALSLDTTVPLSWARSELQRHLAVQGSLDPAYLVVGGTALERATSRILDTLGDGAFVFNLGHGIVPQTPPEHVDQLVAQVRAWRPSEAVDDQA